MTARYSLGRVVEHDPRSRSYRVSGPSPRVTVRWDRSLPALDQGRLGSCTGNAGTGVMATDPYVSATAGTVLDEAYAVALYSDATRTDADPGNDYPPNDLGSSGLAVAKVLKARGLVSGYRHAFGIDDAFAAIQQGPLLVGIPWYEGMFTPTPQGVVTISGSLAGGHEIECVGYDASTDEWEFVNSWGTSWGRLGRFFMSTGTFALLLQRQGDVVLLTPNSQPAPTPTPAPTPASDVAAARATLDAWATKRHVGANATAAAAWKTISAAT